MSHLLQKTARRMVLGLLACAIAMFGATAAAGPAAAFSTVVAKNHALALTVDYDLREFSPDTEDFVVKSTQSQSSSLMKRGSINPRSFSLKSPPTQDGGYSWTKIKLTEQDATGALSAAVTSLLVLHGAIQSQTTITIAVPPNYTWSFFIYTDDGHFSYAHDKVTIKNVVL